MNELVNECFDINSEYYTKMTNIFNEEHIGELYMHHKLPKCFFKAKKIECDDSPDNLIALTLKQHILVHYYAYKCCKDIVKEQLLNAIQLMINTKNRFFEDENTLKIVDEIINKNVVNSGRKEKWLEKANKKYGNKYDYSEVKYVNYNTKVKIKCNQCGHIFWQTPGNHLQCKCACPICSNTYSPTTDEFIKKAKSIYGDKYDYSLVNYIDNKTKVKIICPIHGVFEKAPKMHIYRKQGCPECAYKQFADNQRMSIEEFVERAIEINGDKYDYSEVEYINCETKVKIKCNQCGHIFWQTPDHHINRKDGCPICRYKNKKRRKNEEH